MKRSFFFLIAAVLLFILVSCGTQTEPPAVTDAVTEPPVPTVTVFGEGAPDYAIVIDARASDAVYRFADQIAALSVKKTDVRNDRLAETALEILIGQTKRDATSVFSKQLEEMASDKAFHYIIAEKDGKIVIIADNELGYQYAADYIPAVYVKDGAFRIPEGLCDVQTVTWEEYYASSYYADVLAAEEAARQREIEKEEAMKKLKLEYTEMYKQKAAAFDSGLFGGYNPDKFPAGRYAAPPVYPQASHPRILFTPNTIGEVRKNLTAEENEKAYTRYMDLSDTDNSGMFLTPVDSTSHNMNYDVTAILEAKAFRYAMTGEKYYGYQAIYGIKNALTTLKIPTGSLGDACRAWGYVMYTAGCVYDWCYDLLTEEDKAQIIAGCVNLMGPRMEIGVPPTKQGAVYGHGTEAQLLRDWLTFAIACYDEAPQIYELVAGRLFAEYSEANNYFYKSYNHWEGSMYGPYRLHFAMYANLLIDRMTDGKTQLFSGDIEEVALTFLYYVRPDNQALRIGDVWGESSNSFSLTHYANVAFYTGNYYKNPYLKNYAWQGLSNFGRFTHSNNSLSSVMVLALNDPAVPHTEDYTKLPVTRLTKDPLISLFAKTSWTDKNAPMVYMTMPKAYGASHAHMDCGSFQIFYKGILASDSGKYSTWGDAHHMGYTMQTVSSNSILVYNPAFANYRSSVRGYLVYSGGQSIVGTERAAIPNTLPAILANRSQEQCVSLGGANGEKDGKYLYSYLAGDMTNAYDAETVDEVTRYMLAAVTDNAENPLVFMSFDRITSDDASFRKSALIHVQEEPTVTADGFVIASNTKNGNSGKMVVQSVMTDTEFTLIGGEGKEYWLYDRNADTNDTVNADAIAEYGWGRIEISPAEAAKTDYLLTAIYVTDAKNSAAPIRAKDISTGKLAGASLLGCAMLFPKEEKLLTEEASFTLSGEGSLKCFVAGVSAGRWTVVSGEQEMLTADVAEGTNLLTFTAPAGTYTVKPVQ